jgi:hypothetical protein
MAKKLVDTRIELQRSGVGLNSGHFGILPAVSSQGHGQASPELRRDWPRVDVFLTKAGDRMIRAGLLAALRISTE